METHSDTHADQSHQHTTTDNSASAGTKRWPWILGVVVILAVVGILYGYHSFTSSSVVAAQVHVESGTVLLNGKTITGITGAKIGDTITTEEGLASIFLYESVIVHLEKNTRVVVSDLMRTHPRMMVEQGSTWNTFTKLLGVTGFSVKSSNSVASVRGTSFGFADGWMMVGEGIVNYTWGNKTWDVVSGDMIEMNGTSPIRRHMTGEDWSKVGPRFDRTMTELSVMRWEEIQKHPMLVSLVKSQQGWTEDDLKQKLQNLDSNSDDLDALKQKAPMDVESVDKIADITTAIRAMNVQKSHMESLVHENTVLNDSSS